jgi:hypothetical protein
VSFAFPSSGFREPFENRALTPRALRTAARPKPLQFVCESSQALYALSNERDMRIQKRIDLGAAFCGCVAKLEQSSYLIQRHIERATVADEYQPFAIGFTVKSIIAGTSLGGGHESRALVVTYVLNREF